MTVLTLVAALGAGLNGGVFFAFSTFVMRALERLTPREGIAAMQSINRTAVSAPFMALVFGNAILCLGLGIWTAVSRPDGSAWVLAGAGTFLIGIIVVTVAFNVPLNDALAALDPDAPDAGHRWSQFVTAWTRWNHVRTVSGTAAAALLTVSLPMR